MARRQSLVDSTDQDSLGIFGVLQGVGHGSQLSRVFEILQLNRAVMSAGMNKPMKRWPRCSLDGIRDRRVSISSEGWRPPRSGWSKSLKTAVSRIYHRRKKKLGLDPFMGVSLTDGAPHNLTN